MSGGHDVRTRRTAPAIPVTRNAPGRIRTSDLRFRKPMLYPAELRAPRTGMVSPAPPDSRTWDQVEPGPDSMRALIRRSPCSAVMDPSAM